MEFNELESPEMIRCEIQSSVLFKIRDKIQSLYKSKVFVGYTTTYIIHPCLYIKESISQKILFFNQNKIKNKLLVEAVVYDISKIRVWVMDGVIYTIVRDEFERFGKEHENSISKLDIVKHYQEYHSGSIKENKDENQK